MEKKKKRVHILSKYKEFFYIFTLNKSSTSYLFLKKNKIKIKSR